ncbi:EscU/YscU/HrcU family type III secretion system export apparatus switch protein [Desulfitibacter alkalitolerans]|uniref:EscU/YscU/HrcU family type III secretion system export apparatus switch protein n=1 Tax=Desulfitibacter alkalitolerans TaxID=264641 RepID=UPI0004835264|nr:EscU/YscU/HrcU family type III secretion system export apparatus switch protein [Desulfitibacter alkalitolerans]
MKKLSKKPIKLAAALKYVQTEDDAPVVIAAGKGITAENIVKKAKEEGIHVHEDQALADMLASMEIGSEIPPELYQAVAHILAFVWKLDNKNRSFNKYFLGDRD